MNYQEARDKIQSGDIIAWSHYNWGSWYDFKVQSVQIVGRTPYCHVAVAYRMGGRLWVIEAVKPCVRMVPLSNLIQPKGFYWLNVNVPMTDDELEFGLSGIAIREYSEVQAVQAQLDMLEIGADTITQCAENTIEMRRRSGIDFGPKATPAAVMLKGKSMGFPELFITP